MELSTDRKADRQRMAEILKDIADKLDITCRIEPSLMDPRGLTVFFTHDEPLGLTTRVCLRPKQGAFVIPWTSRRELADAFGDVNPYHHSKATHVAWGFDALQREIATGLARAVDGSAYRNQA